MNDMTEVIINDLVNARPTLPATPYPEVPSHLSGVTGWNRRFDVGMLQAQNDREAIAVWVAKSGEDSDHTRASYIKEADRLYRWAILQLGKPLSALTHEDMLVYWRFLEDPQPADLWVTEKANARYSRKDERWRPFAGKLSPPSIRQAKIILNAMFAWMVEAGYLKGNPLSLSRTRKKKQPKRLKRFLSRPQWNAVIAYLKTMPSDTDEQRAEYHLSRWVMVLLYGTGMRISELCSTTMGAVYQTEKDGVVRWWVEVVGKGDKARQIPLSEEIMAELGVYRQALGLAALPYPGEMIPLAGSGQVSGHMHRSTAHRLVKAIFSGAANLLRLDDKEYDAGQLEHASAHWLRHTAGTRMVDAGVDLRTIKENFGHESLATTSLYTHRDEDLRHDETALHKVFG